MGRKKQEAELKKPIPQAVLKRNKIRHSVVGADELNLLSEVQPVVKIDSELKAKAEVYSWSAIPGNYTNYQKGDHTIWYAVHSKFQKPGADGKRTTKQTYLHYWVWQQFNGPVENGFIKFKDKNGLNCKIDNLYLVKYKCRVNLDS